MASRYWVGGTAAWDATAGSKWSTTSGGAGGAAVPTNADDVIFDANSGAVTITIQTAVAVGGSFNASAFTGTLVQSTNFNIGSSTAGDFIFGTGMTFTYTAGNIKLLTTKVSNTSVNLAGKTIGGIAFNGSGATFVFQNDITATGAVAFSGGSVDMNGFNVTADHLSNANTTTRNTNMRGGTITLTGTGAVFDAPGGTLTFSWTTGAKFVISNTSASAKTFAGTTHSFPPIQVSGAAAAGIVTFSGAFTTDGFILGPNSSVKFTSGTTTTATTFSATGTTLAPITIQSTTPASAATLSVSSGIVSCDYLVLQDSTATGGATFYAGNNSTNVSGNTGWIFTAAPATTTQTETGVARIQIAVTKTETGVARVTAVTPQTETGKARITAATAQTETGKARIMASTTKTETGLARITAVVLKTIQGLARVTAVATKTETGVSRIQKAATKTITGLSRLQVSVAKTIQGLARITGTTGRTETGTARITATTTRTNTGKARIQITTSQTSTGKARVTVSTLKTVTGKARVQGTTTKTETGVGRITATTAKTQTGIARILTIVLKTVTGVASIYTTVLKTITGKAKINATTTRTETGKASVLGITKQIITGVAHILAQPADGKEHYVLTTESQRQILDTKTVQVETIETHTLPMSDLDLKTSQISTLGTAPAKRVVL
jgi:hypothetical protein